MNGKRSGRNLNRPPRNFSKAFFLSLVSVLYLAGTLSVFPQTSEQLNFYSDRISSGTVEEKRDALLELSRFGSESASRAAAMSLNDLSAIVRATAIGAVIYLPKNEAAGLIEPLLRDPSDFVRREAVHALGVISFPASADSLISVLRNDDDAEVRAGAAVALGQIGNTRALDSLVKILESKPKSSRAFIRRSAARSIGQIAEKSRAHQISTSTPESFLPDRFKSGYGKQMPDVPFRDMFARSVSVLGKVLANRKESNDTRREAAFALGAIGDESSILQLKRYTNDPDYYLAEICREAIIKLSDR